MGRLGETGLRFIQHPAVVEVAVIGASGDYGGETVKAIIVLTKEDGDGIERRR